MIKSMIMATADNGVIGVNSDLPWRMPKDLKRFKEITTGHPIIMGRKTHESIGRPLPNRYNIVITQNPLGYIWEKGVFVARSMSEAWEQAIHIDGVEGFVIGGAQIYRESISEIDRLYLTEVHCSPQGDTRFDSWRTLAWKTTHQQFGVDNGIHYTFSILDRIWS